VITGVADRIIKTTADEGYGKGLLLPVTVRERGNADDDEERYGASCEGVWA
jgi:hypothetical protein